jgi:4-hydroxythreonine-4-phosphate dehydrogenase
MSKQKAIIGVSIGDFNGIGLEVILKTFMDNRILDYCIPVVYGSSKLSSFHRKVLGINDFSFNIVKSVADINLKRANLVNCWDEELAVELGKSTETAGQYAVKSLEFATKDLLDGKIDALVTAPINKNNIQSSSFKYPGHTEYLMDIAKAKDCLMLLMGDTLKVGVVTGHVPLKDVSGNINEDKILRKLRILNQSLFQDFSLPQPKIAVLGLNPHSGDNGLLGKEEKEVIEPAIERARAEGILAFGPYPADGFFGSGTFSKFDAVLGMYHDQGLIPFKTIEFENGVNFTAGLPFVRTSPDHGTGYDIAGKNQADPSSFRNAVFSAIKIAARRKENLEMVKNAMKVTKKASGDN